MLLITCPWCGPRAEIEFSCGGEANIQRPTPSAEASDAAWANYLFMRTNPRGRAQEQWLHANGCRRWFKVERDTVSYAIIGTSKFRIAQDVKDEGGAQR